MQYFAGIDVGSLSTDVVILDEEKRVVGSAVVPTGARSLVAVEKAFKEALAEAGLAKSSLSAVIATGYGREKVPDKTKSVTEITCHARGAYHLFPATRLVIDVGGQDSKVIALGNSGKVLDFAMNDKCAAGTGRFMEVMARTLEIELDQVGQLVLQATDDISISSMCTVFAESEVVSLVAQGVKVPDILWGLCKAVGDRTFALAQKVGVAPEVTMTGGVAKNGGVVRALERRLALKLNIPDEPQIVGALGAALIALEQSTTLQTTTSTRKEHERVLN